jgi:CysZ protein
LLIAGAGVIVFFLANAYLLSREFFELAAFRAEGVAAGRARRRANAGRIFLYGLPIAAIALVPILNLIVPVFGTILMVHAHKAMTRA